MAVVCQLDQCAQSAAFEKLRPKCVRFPFEKTIGTPPHFEPIGSWLRCSRLKVSRVASVRSASMVP